MNENETTGFEHFGLSAEVMQGITECGFKSPSPIQQQTIPLLLEGRDMIGQAHTGTGKTAAFGLPSISRLKKTGEVEMLVITPTRELAMQVSDELYRYGKYADINTTTVYGGQSYARQYERLRRGTPIVVATPGRLLDILSSGKVKSFAPSIVVLDEADEMLDMGFLEDIQKIFTFLPEDRQTLLFSATMPDSIRKLAANILKNPAHISVMNKEKTVKDIDQRYYVIEEQERDDAIIRLIDSFEPTRSIIFCRTKKEVERICTTLIGRGYSAKGLHGDMEQHQREEVMTSFRDGRIYTLVATDVAARGLDVKDVTHVFNYHMPFDSESYIHRIGRTGRAGSKGIAVTLVTPQELRGLNRIQRSIGDVMTQKFIPTLSEVRDENIAKLVDKVAACEIDKKAAEVLEMLTSEHSEVNIALKLVSMLLDKESCAGPNQIGLSPKRIERVLEDEKRDRMDKSKGRGGNRRSAGGSRDRYSRDRSERSGDSRGSGYSRERSSSDRFNKDRSERPAGDRFSKDRSDRPAGDRFSKDRSERPAGDRFSKDRSERPVGDRPARDRKEGDRSSGSFRDKPRSAEGQPRSGGWSKFDKEPRPEREKTGGDSFWKKRNNDK
ncbi:DEAD/DEAH box helicase [Geovibrio thiophilus]|uniref:DEAD/DEAH box helicase n=1 Tax=Geovibrio thiophilus TaxID=139438 RepID=A0A410JW85_9BACT|nr:DEAD/DEAH box helicase [Geovibrio thiophilus]QAR32452.1 DEAD/DEAH box helicase [Geovibrio thiophilus]